MLAHNNPDIQEAVTTVYQLTQEEKIRQQCEAREDYYRRQNDVQRWIKKQAETIKEQNDTIEELKQTVEKQAEIINELRKQAAQLQSEPISNS